MIVKIDNEGFRVDIDTDLGKKDSEIAIRVRKKNNRWFLFHPYEFHWFKKEVHLTDSKELDWAEYKFLWFSIC